MDLAFADQGISLSEDPDSYKAGKLSPSMRTLEDEIDDLRKEMEQTFLQEASFQADNVIDISRRLDLKINEYMMHKWNFCNRRN
ncbi:hypothetical protein VN24_02090 [Paenibacillus beijingensis]|uniref:Sporulation protein Spo0E n=2 Tax=Paenibacillus beijingensis TaxID=1126833 RepID=A0A0D5NFG1_9BACL|nr:hypothetical protein VN24_02090 [Paenibacillus beijingensis]